MNTQKTCFNLTYHFWISSQTDGVYDSKSRHCHCYYHLCYWSRPLFSHLFFFLSPVTFVTQLSHKKDCCFLRILLPHRVFLTFCLYREWTNHHCVLVSVVLAHWTNKFIIFFQMKTLPFLIFLTSGISATQMFESTR